MKTLRNIAALLVATFVISYASAQDKMKMGADTSKKKMMHDKMKMKDHKMMSDTSKMKMHHEKMKMEKMKPEGKM